MGNRSKPAPIRPSATFPHRGRLFIYNHIAQTAFCQSKPGILSRKGGGDACAKTKSRAVYFSGGGGGTAAHRHPCGVGRVPTAGHAGVRLFPRAGYAGVCGAGRGLWCGLRGGRFAAGCPRSAFRRVVGHGPIGGRVLRGGVRAARQRRIVSCRIQFARRAGQCVSSPGGAGLRPKMVSGQKRLGHRRGGCGHGAVRRVFYGVCQGRRRGVGHPRLLCGAGGGHARRLRYGGADFARPAA